MMRFLVVLVMLMPGMAPSQTSEQSAQAAETILANQAAEERFQECPADIYQTRRPSALVRLFLDGQNWSYGMCEGREAACLNGASGACFSLALQIQAAEELGEVAAEVLFSESCAGGMAGGCTNRAASIRLDAEDAQSHAHPQVCAGRTFALTCEADDPWGCTMLGRHLMSGDGVAKDEAAALQAFEKACGLTDGAEQSSMDRDAAPCRAATRFIRALRAPKK